MVTNYLRYKTNHIVPFHSVLQILGYMKPFQILSAWHFVSTTLKSTCVEEADDVKLRIIVLNEHFSLTGPGAYATHRV